MQIGAFFMGMMGLGRANYSGGLANNSYDAISMANNPRAFSGRNSRQSMLSYIEQNEVDYQIEVQDAFRVATTRFKWSGKSIEHLPYNYIEQLLFWGGRCIAFNHKEFGRCIAQGFQKDLNAFFEPCSFNVILNGMKGDYCVNIDECVDIRENPAAISPAWSIMRQAFLVSDCGRAVQNNINALKKTQLLKAKNKGGLTAEFVAKSMLDNSPYLIIEDESLKVQEETKNIVEQLGSSADTQSLIGAKQTLFNNMLSRLGINTNMQAQKSQYRSSMEIEGDTSHVELILKQCMECRLKAVEEMKSKLGWDIEVENQYENAAREAAELTGNAKVGNEDLSDDV